MQPPYDLNKRFSARNAVILTRVSSKEQEEGYSVDAQRHRLENYCDRNRLEVLEIFELTESSTAGDRVKFMQMIDFLKKKYKANKKTDARPLALVADKVDRVQRSFKEYPMLDQLINEGIIELHFNTENYIIHRDSVSSERLMWSFGVLMAQSYVDNLRDNVRRSLDHKIRLGEYSARAPIGYLNIRTPNNKSDIIPDPDRALLVRRLFETYAAGGRTLKEMAELCASWGLRTASGKNNLLRSYIHNILTNKFYIGIMTVNGVEHPHRYERLISAATFESCNRHLKGWQKKPFQYGEKDFIFRGLIQCAVSGKTSSAFKRTKSYQNGGTGEWTYWRCTDPENTQKTKFVREEVIIDQIESALKTLTIPAKERQELDKELRSTSKMERDFYKRQISDLRKEQDNVTKKQDQLLDLLMEGAIGRVDYERKKTSLSNKQRDLKNQLDSMDNADDGFKDALLSLIDLCADAHALWQGSQNAEKRALANLLFDNLTLEGEKLQITWAQPFIWFSKCTKIEEWRALAYRLRTSPDLRLLIIKTKLTHKQ